MNLKKLILIFLVLQLLFPHKLSEDITKQLIIWNVGQGQWVTYIKNNFCYHMDMGGEFAPIVNVLSKCKNKNNWIYISHADKDHINFYKKYTQQVRSHCLVAPTKSFLKYNGLKRNKFRLCPLNKSSPIKILYSPKNRVTKNRNELSKVFIIENQVLNPGDSLRKNEEYWAKKSDITDITILILGHHGSLTSSSDFLINKLPKLKFSVASARKKRYGHPHGRIKLKLDANKTPVLSTEQWSHITIRL